MMSVMHDFTGKVAMVSGAAAGIGKATALAFARAHATIVVVDIDAARGEDTAREIESLGAVARFHTADLTDADQVATLFDAIEAEFGRLDCAHNNVGFGWGTGLLDCTPHD